MSNRTAKAALSKENEDLIAAGHYTVRGARIDLSGFVSAATRDVVFYSPEDTASLLQQMGSTSLYNTTIEITPETSTGAAARLHSEGHHPVVLNFASATKPGGGYLTGARAQEEDLCRSSALYTSLLRAPQFYAWHKANRDGRYSHRLIWTPNVVVFRDAVTSALLPTPYLTSFITAAAPNAGAIAKNNPAALPHIPTILRERAARILAVAAKHDTRCLVLGAWGTGVFRNAPDTVAGIFAQLLNGPFSGRFEKVVFAVYDTSAAGNTLRAFEDAFPVSATVSHIDPTGIRRGVALAAASGGQSGPREQKNHRRHDNPSAKSTASTQSAHHPRPASPTRRDKIADAAEARNTTSLAGYLSQPRSDKPRASDSNKTNGTLDSWVIRK